MSPSVRDLLGALRDATDAVSLAQAADYGSITIALERLETATALLARADLPADAHALVRREIDQAGLVTKRLFEDMIAERDRLGSEIHALRAGRSTAAATCGGIDFTL